MLRVWVRTQNLWKKRAGQSTVSDCVMVEKLLVSRASHATVLVDPYGGGDFTLKAGAVSERRVGDS